MERPSARWEDPRTVAGFVSSPPNAELIAFARRFVAPPRRARALDLGGGAGRNAFPLADLGFDVALTDLSAPMLHAATRRRGESNAARAVRALLAPMARLPFRDESFDLVVAHGIWNLARSGAELARALDEAARVARPGAGLFVFTFSRRTLQPGARADPGEAFVFSSWNGEPACFLTADELLELCARAGFAPHGAVPLRELNLPRPGELPRAGPPVILEGTFVRRRNGPGGR